MNALVVNCHRVTAARLRYSGAWLLLALVTSFATIAHAGQGVWTSNGPYSGDITALAIDPTNPATVYAGASGGGVFKSTDAGGTWAAANTGLTEPYVQALVISPSSPGTLYAIASYEVFRSTDSGGTWVGPNTGLKDYYVGFLVIDPANPDTLYAKTYGGGVLKSNDGGGSWTAVGLADKNVWALAIDPANPLTVYAGTPGAGVFKSTNGGESWAPVNTGLMSTDVRALAIDPVTPTTLYANTVNGGSAGADVLYKSTNGGESWAAISKDLTAAYVLDLAIDPSAPTTLYAGTANGGVFKSSNGGESWGTINTGLTETFIQALVIDPSAGATLYAGTLVGVFKSKNGGGGWTTANTGLKSVVSALAIDPSAPSNLFAGTAPYGAVFKTADGGGSWTAIHALYTRLQALAIDPSGPATLYAGTSSDFFYEYPGVFESTDGGANWTQRLYADVYALVIDSSTPATLYAGTNGGVFKSIDSGGTWAAANTGLTNQGVLALVISPTNRATLFAGTYGGVFQSTDSGGTWAAAGLASQVVQALAINPVTPATLYAGTFRGGVFRSTDAGATWAAASTGLTNLKVQALAIDPTTPATLYAGTGGGVFRSTDSGGSWAAFNTGLPNLSVNALAFDPTGATTLYAGLEGGGVWQLTASTTVTITALLPASAHSSGANGAFYTTNISVANTGTTAASFTLKFLGHDQDGSNGPERSFNLGPGKSTTFFDVLESLFNQTNDFGAIRVTSNTSTLDIISVTSTPGFGGTFGQAIPAVAFADLIPAGSSRSILYMREGDGFRTNLVLASGSSVSTDVDVVLIVPASPWDYARIGLTVGAKTYTVPPNGMIQVNRVVRDLGISGLITGARLVLSSSTAGALFTGLASVIDETTNDPAVVLAQPAAVSGSAPYVWLLPASARAGGLSGAFYTTNLAVANVGALPASFTMKFLGHDQDGSDGPEQTFNLESGKSVTYFDVLGTAFHQVSAFGSIRITSDTPSLNIASVTSTPGFGGTLSQTIPAIPSADLIHAGTSRSIVYIHEGDGFRTNLILASNASVSTTVDVALVSPAGATLAAKSYSVPPNGMTQIDRVVRDMGVSGAVTGARLVLSSSTLDATFTAFASVIDEVTNDSSAVEAK